MRTGLHNYAIFTRTYACMQLYLLVTCAPNAQAAAVKLGLMILQPYAPPTRMTDTSTLHAVTCDQYRIGLTVYILYLLAGMPNTWPIAV